MVYVDYCLIVNLYGKPRKKKPITKFREQYKYDLRIIIVIICPWYLLKNPCGENRRYDMYMSKIPLYENPGGENKRYDI